MKPFILMSQEDGRSAMPSWGIFGGRDLTGSEFVMSRGYHLISVGLMPDPTATQKKNLDRLPSRYS